MRSTVIVTGALAVQVDRRLSNYTASASHPPTWAAYSEFLLGMRDFGRQRAYDSNFLHFQRAAELDRIVTHEYVHALVQQMFPRVPGWLNEGLATLMESSDSTWLTRRLRAAGELIPLNSLDEAFRTTDGDEAALAYAQKRRLPTAEYRALGDVVEYRVARIVEECKLPPAADEQLHVVVAELVGAADALRSADGMHAHAAVRRATLALNRYGKHFDHPGWKPLP